MITPILKDPKVHGGTLYTFPSASRDMTRAFSNSEYEFAFSHFACLNLPDFRYGHHGNDANKLDPKGIYLEDLHEYSIDSVNNLNTSLKWHLQSYVMNYEVAILNGYSLDAGKYDTEILKTPSERIFFNWLQRVNAIKFNSKNEEVLDGYADDIDPDVYYETVTSLDAATNKNISYKIGNKFYTWKGGEWRYRVLISKTVQYIGTIDMINNVNIDFDSFNEIYLNIPANVGGSTKVHFDNSFDDNYEYGEIIDVDKDKYCDDPKYIIGRDPYELYMSDDKTFEAIYDYDTDNDKSHKYKIETGYCINFSDSKYNDFGGSIEEMNLRSEEDFEFNCVLIYYRIRKGDGSWYTNLYGVLFLEEVTTSDFKTTSNNDDERAGYIQRYPKYKKGNSWGLKLDLKIDAQPDSQLLLRDREYDDPNNSGIGMQMFTEALMQLNDCSKLFFAIKDENIEMKERINSLENLLSGVDSMGNMRSEIAAIRTRMDENQPFIHALEGRIDSLETEMYKLQSDMGNLINLLTTQK